MKDIPAVQDTVTFAADTLENFAKYISKTSVERIAADASGFVKRYPIAVIAAGVTVGLVAIVAASQTKFSGLSKYGNTKGRNSSGRSARCPPGAKNSNLSANLH